MIRNRTQIATYGCSQINLINLIFFDKDQVNQDDQCYLRSISELRLFYELMSKIGQIYLFVFQSWATKFPT